MENPTSSTAIPKRWAGRFFTIWSGQAFVNFVAKGFESVRNVA